MPDARTTQKPDSATTLRAQRGAAAVVAQYLRDLSDRGPRAPRSRTGHRVAFGDGGRTRKQLYPIESEWPCTSES